MSSNQGFFVKVFDMIISFDDEQEEYEGQIGPLKQLPGRRIRLQSLQSIMPVSNVFDFLLHTNRINSIGVPCDSRPRVFKRSSYVRDLPMIDRNKSPKIQLQRVFLIESFVR